MSRAVQSFDTLRTLPAHRQEEILTRLEADITQAPTAPLLRQIEIVRRHIFGGEPKAVLCTDFEISTQQFYVDRREALKRLNAVVGPEISVHDPMPARVEEPIHVLLAEAQSLFNAGATLRAAQLLLRLSAEALEPRELLSAVALGADIHEDIGYFEGSEVLLERCRHWLRGEREDSAEHRMAAAALHWLSGEVALRRGDERTYTRSIDIVPNLLKPLIAAGDNDAIKAVGAFWNHVVHSYPGNPQEIAASGRKALDFLETRSHLPVHLRAELLASSAYLNASSPNSLSQARRERDAALAFAVQNAVPRAVWMCLYLGMTDSVLRDDLEHALVVARTLAESVGETDSLEWKRISRIGLSSLYVKLGMFESAEQLNGLGSASSPLADPKGALERCVLFVARRQFREAVSLTTRLLAFFESPGDHVYRAEALQLRAISRFHLGDTQQASFDIRSAIEIYESLGTWLVYTLRDAYRVAYQITKEDAFRDGVHGLRSETPADELPTPEPRRARPTLSARQRQIATLAAAGQTNRQIADELGLSHRTVGNHLATIFEQLGIRARWQLEEALKIPH